MWWMTYGCARGPQIAEDPALDTPEHAPLARSLTVRTEDPSSLAVHLVGDGVDVRIEWPGRRRDHDVLLLGAKVDRAITATLELTDRRGSTEIELGYHTDPLPDTFPDLEVLALDPGGVEPGYRLLTLGTDHGPFLAAVDAWDGEVAYLYDGPEDLGDVEVTPEGTLLGLGSGVLELRFDGEVARRWNDRGELYDPAWIPVAFQAEHHEVTRIGPDAFVTLTHRTVSADAYPRSTSDPRPVAPATLEDAGIVTFSGDGRVHSTLWYSDALDTSRIGFDALNRSGGGYDWVHGNAVVPLPDGGWLASARHQDALFALDADGALRWILASPAGWSEEYAPYVLELDGSPTYHQHGPNLDAAGRIVVFDNHNDGYNPYEPPVAEQPPSRVVAYAIDEEAGRATQVWQWVHPDGLFSGALGNASPQPGGTVVACFGFLEDEGGPPNRERGLGNKVTRVVEFVPGVVSPLFDLRVSYPRDLGPGGVRSYRAVPTPTLYAQDVRVDRRP